MFLFATAVMVFVLGFGMSAFADDPHSHNDVVFQPWESDSKLPTQEGNYYLTKDVTLYEAHRFLFDNSRVYNYHLCLNGHSIKIAEGQNNKNIQVGNATTCRSTLSIYDCRNSGTIEGQPEGYGPANAGGIAVNPGSTLNLYGGTIKNCTADSNGGGVSVYRDNTNGNGIFNMYGGKICDCIAGQKGGAVYVTGTFNMYGGTIEDCIVRNSNSAGGIYVYSNANTVFSLSGSPVIQNNIYKSRSYSTQYDRNIYLDTGKTITIAGKLTNTGLIGVMCNDNKPYAFTTGYNSYMGTVEPTEVFKSDDSQFVVSKTDAGEGKLVKQYDLYVGGIQVTDDKLSDDSGWNFNPNTYTLSLNNYTSAVCHSGSTGVNAIINYAGTSIPLTISFTGANTLDASDETNGGNGIYSNSRNIILEGNGTLNIKGNGIGAGVSLRSSATLIINSGTITAEGYKGLSGKTTINGGDVTAIATGTVAAALDSTLINAIPGKGWNNTDYSDVPEVIDVSSTSRYVYKYYKAHFPHAHSLTYSASSATITAVCNNTDSPCTLKVDGEGKYTTTLTIVAPTKKTYGDAGDATAALNGLDDFNTATGKAIEVSQIQYYKATRNEQGVYEKNGDALQNGAPVDAGDYLAELTLTDVKTADDSVNTVTASLGYTIAPQIITSIEVTDVTAPVAAETLDKAAATTTNNVTLSDGGAITWNPAPPADNKAAYAKEYTATVKAEAQENYAFSDQISATMKVNGEEKTAIPKLNSDGTLSVSYTFGKTALTPVTIDAAEMGVIYSPEGIDIPVQGMFTITEGAGKATYEVIKDTGEGTYDAQTGKLTVTECGTFTVTVNTAETQTHDAAKASAKLTVNKAASTPATVTANALTYTGGELALVTVDDSKLVGGDMQYALGTDDQTPPTSGWGADIPKGTEAKKYYVWYKVVGDKNHNPSAEKCVTVTIDKVASTPAAVTANALTYTGQAQALVTVDDSKLVGGDMQYALSDNDKTSPASGWGADIPKGTEAKKYYVWYRVKAGNCDHKGRRRCARSPEAGNAGL